MLSKNSLNAEPTPNWVENLVLGGMMDEYNGNELMNLIIFVELRYVMQWKDLKQSFRYPHSTNTVVALNNPTDVLQEPNVPCAWGSTS
ncbi:hypothetical protein PC129_g11369 [Phytophthora cactorum]|uniref:Uncharacterized protein n=1 Tax=Phytophthora cactorum TaxID=29920 RepID=A0A8T0YPC9_9STRA|nr:hypothetical protein Pcac1_g10612 [Phytophthora cactorum]KAG2805593.1 hypothetical protein PC111_g17743 [Phytophthora cactorum]KAG2819211.1 hypothetical protein PC112_g12271 [Phytophthora cactorum]KAG2850838.1 hypothetical protein PC113_g16426 [Phytophthora cactorum]KAG2900931.1 hypothetical protein PC114_g13371 [Phytophthora cactorum]